MATQAIRPGSRMSVVAHGATYLSDMGLVGIYVAFTLLGNFCERSVTLYTFYIYNGLVVVYLCGFAMAGSTVYCFSLVDGSKTAAR
jgi:hypothetical protein